MICLFKKIINVFLVVTLVSTMTFKQENNCFALEESENLSFEVENDEDEERYTINISSTDSLDFNNKILKFFIDDSIESIANADILMIDNNAYYVELNSSSNENTYSFSLLSSSEPYDFELVDNFNGISENEVDDTVVLDADDFDTSDFKTESGMDQMNRILESEPATVTNTATQTVTAQTKIEIDLTNSIYHRNNDESKTYAIQNFYIDDDYLYITQNIGNGDIAISKCEFTNDEHSTARYLNSMRVNGVGHGQTLEMYTYNGNQYFLFACGSKLTGTVYWSTQIGRIEYCENTVLDNAHISRFNYLAYANKTNSNFGTTKRTDAALSSDKESLLIWKRNSDDHTECSVYSLDEFNSQLDETGGTAGYTVSFKNNTDMKNACESSFNGTNTALNMCSYLQGIDLSNIANNLRSIYIASGDQDEENKPLEIRRFNSAGTYRNIINISHNFRNSSNTLKDMELEGLHINGNYLDFVLVECTGNKTTQYICSVLKNNLA